MHRPAARRTNQPTSRPDLHTNPATPHYIHTPGEILRISERLTNVLKSRYDVQYLCITSIIFHYFCTVLALFSVGTALQWSSSSFSNIPCSLTHSHIHFFLLTHLNSCSPQHQEAPMDPVNEHLKSIVYENHTLKVIDQLKLPTVLEYIHIHTVQDAFDVIR